MLIFEPVEQLFLSAVAFSPASGWARGQIPCQGFVAAFGSKTILPLPLKGTRKALGGATHIRKSPLQTGRAASPHRTVGRKCLPIVSTLADCHKPGGHLLYQICRFSCLFLAEYGRSLLISHISQSQEVMSAVLPPLEPSSTTVNLFESSLQILFSFYTLCLEDACTSPLSLTLSFHRKTFAALVLSPLARHTGGQTLPRGKEDDHAKIEQFTLQYS